MLTTQHYNIATILQILGVVALFAIGAASFITSPPADFGSLLTQGSSAKTTQVKPQVAPGRDEPWFNMIKTTEFWMLFGLYFLGAAPGLMLLSAAKDIFTALGGFNSTTATSLVAILAAANAIGRIFWGSVSDFLGRLNTLAVMFICSACAMFLLPQSHDPSLLVGIILVIGSTYGGYLGLFPSFCADSFGLKHLPLNYAVLFIGFSVAAFVGPWIYGSIHDKVIAFYLAAGLSTSGVILSLMYKFVMKKG